MSRRFRHGRPPHRPHRAHQDATRSGPPSPAASPGAAPSPSPARPAPAPEPPEPRHVAVADQPAEESHVEASRTEEGPRSEEAKAGHAEVRAPADDRAAAADAHGRDAVPAEPIRPAATQLRSSGNGHAEPGADRGTCTPAQLRRFIKSRPWVPMHELRRRFAINGTEDDVAMIETPEGRLFVGLPAREAGMLGELLRGGDIGYELALDPGCPMIIGVFPMRPVARS